MYCSWQGTWISNYQILALIAITWTPRQGELSEKNVISAEETSLPTACLDIYTKQNLDKFTSLRTSYQSIEMLPKCCANLLQCVWLLCGNLRPGVQLLYNYWLFYSCLNLGRERDCSERNVFVFCRCSPIRSSSQAEFVWISGNSKLWSVWDKWAAQSNLIKAKINK